MGKLSVHENVLAYRGPGPGFVQQTTLTTLKEPLRLDLDGRIEQFRDARLFRVGATARLIVAGDHGPRAVMLGAGVEDVEGLSRAAAALAGKIDPEDAAGWGIRLETAAAAGALFEAAGRCDCGAGGGLPGTIRIGFEDKKGRMTWCDPSLVTLRPVHDSVGSLKELGKSGHVTWSCRSNWYSWGPWGETVCDGLCPAATPACSCNSAKSGVCSGWWWCSCK
jgi:hypothetical protein